MIFNYVTISGFRSFKNRVVFDLGQNGIYQVLGKNGAGKTSLFEAIFWCLYGESLKTGSVVESQSGEPISVDVNFALGEDSYTITRTDKALVLLENGFSRGLYKKDTQQRIIEVLGLTSMQFLNSVLMAQRGVRVADYSEKERREFFETLFELDWVDELGEKVKQKSQELNTALAVQNNQLQSLNRELDNLNNEKATVEQRQEVFDREQKNIAIGLDTEYHLCLGELRNHIKTQPEQFEIDDTSESKDVISIAKEKLSIVKEEISKLINNTRLLDQELQFHKRDEPREPETTCTKCGQSTVDEEVWASVNEKYLQEYATWRLVGEDIVNRMPKTAELDSLKETKKSLEDLIVDHTNYVQRWDMEQSKYLKLVNDWELSRSKLENKVQSAEKALEINKNAPKPNFTQWLSDISDKVNTAKMNLVVLEGLLEDYGKEKVMVDYWVKALGLNALKSHITQSYFQKLNQYISYYGQLFGFGLRFSMDLSKKLTKSELEIWRLTGDSVPYGNLSGGEKARVELALQLAIAKLIAPKASLIIFDESMIGLDQDGLDSIREIFTQISKEKAVYFISHLGESHLYTNTIEVVKTESGSKIKI